jgi:pyruvyltransferase
MSNVIYLFWYKKKDHFNFGDDINPYIIENLSNKKVKRVMVFGNRKSIMFNFLKIIRGILLGFYNTSDLTEYTRSLIHKDYLVCIGSILQHNFSKQAKIWGSGIIHNETLINESDFYAVRGLKTVARIKSLGYNFTGQIGDPALLLPIIYNPTISKNNKIGIIPHVIHFEDSKDIFSDQNKFVLIDLSDNNIQKTIDQIKSCKFILTSSLHGLIVPHAYNVPSLHIQLEGSLSGDGIKFLDYYSSVGIKDYYPIKVSPSKLTSIDYINGIFEANREYTVPNKDIVSKIQRDLLSVAPFDLDDKYKSYISVQ